MSNIFSFILLVAHEHHMKIFKSTRYEGNSTVKHDSSHAGDNSHAMSESK